MGRWAWMLCWGCCSLWLSACATLSAPAAPPAPVAAGLLHDAAFRAPAQPPTADGLFALSPAMQAFVDRQLQPHRQHGDLRRLLLEQLYRQRGLALEYDATRTRTAAEAYEARAGNCLSLVVMTAAFAKALEMPVDFQRVDEPESWTRTGRLEFASSHVNIALSLPRAPGHWQRLQDPVLVVDFLPSRDLEGRRVQSLSERTITAMYLNNRAAETLAEGDTDGAYWWARAAVQQDAQFPAAWNTLGVVYLHHGLLDEAGQVFSTLLAREPDNPKVLSNLATTAERQGRGAEAAALRERLARLDPQPPFHYFDAGLRAMADRDYAQAREWFALELRRDAYWHELHYWMARAELALGHRSEGRRHLELAREVSHTPRERAIYAAKLDWLRTQQ